MENQTAEDFQPISLADLWDIFIRRKMLILFLALFALLSAMFYLKITTKIYYARSVILLENQTKNLQIEALINNYAIDSAYVSSEMQVLLSRELVEQALDEMDLFDKPHLLWPPQSLLRKIKSSLSFKKEKPSPQGPKSKEKEERDDLQRKNKLIDYALSNLKVDQIDTSRAVEIGFTSPHKEIAAEIVNTLVDLYIRGQINTSTYAVSSTNQWLRERVEELRKDVKEIDTAIVEYKKKSGFISSSGITLIENEIDQLSKKLINEQASLAAARVKWQEINSNKGMSTAPEVLKSPIIQRLIDRQLTSKDKVAELSREYGSNHPEMLSAQNRLQEVTEKINAEIRKIAQSLKREYEIIKANAKEIEEQLAALKNKYNELKAQSVKLRELEREEANRKSLLAKIDLRWKEIQVQEDQYLQEPIAKILSRANIPTNPKSPKPKLVILVSLIGGIGLGLALAIMLEYMQTNVYNGQQLQQSTGLTNIAFVPRLRSSGQPDIHESVMHLTKSPTSDYTESVRSLTTYLRQNINKPNIGNIFNFTSVSRGDGKSALVSAAACQMSLEGRKVIVIDCDLQNPSLGYAFGLGDEPGLSDALSGKKTLKQVIYKDEETGIHLIGIGQLQDINIIKKGAAIWRDILQAVSEEFDVVLLDGPPALYISDMTILAERSQNILCVPWKKVPLKHVTYAQSVLTHLNFSLLGTVITLVNPKKMKLLHDVS